MAVKYVKDFAFDSGFGFSGSSGKTPVRAYMRGGAVKSNPTKAPSIAPAMVEKRSQGLGGLAKETKKLAAYDKPHVAGKKGAKVAQYAKGGVVKKAHAKKEMPSFLKAKMMKKANGGPVAEITEGDGMSPLQAMAEEPPPLKSLPEEPNYNDPRYIGPGQLISEGRREPIGDLLPLPPEEPNYVGPAPRALDMVQVDDMIMTREDAERMNRSAQVPSASAPMMERPVPIGLAPPRPSPLAAAARMPKADRREMMADRREVARDIMDRYIAGPRRAMGARGIGESRARRAMPVAPSEPMIKIPRGPRGGVATFAKGGKVSKGEAKVGKVMGEFKRGELHSGSKKGPVVKNPKQAVAIALSEARAAGAKVPKRKAMGGKACG